MKKITTNSYEIRFSNDGYDYLNSLLSKKSYSKLFVIVDENTDKYLLNSVAVPVNVFSSPEFEERIVGFFSALKAL